MTIVAEAKELTIWVHLEGVATSTDVRIVDTEYVSALCREIIRAFPTQLTGRGASDLVVKAPTAPLPVDTDPKTVDPKAFGQVLYNPKAKLIEVLKPTIQGAKGEYEVYAELSVKNEGDAADTRALVQAVREGMAPLVQVLACAHHLMDGWSGRSPSTAEEKEARKRKDAEMQEGLKRRAIALYKVGSRERKEIVTTIDPTSGAYFTKEVSHPELKCMLSGEWLPYAEVRCAYLLPKKRTAPTTLQWLGLPLNSLNEPQNTNLWAERIERAFDAKELCFEPVPLRTNQLKCRILDPTLNQRPISKSSTVLSQMEGRILEFPAEQEEEEVTRRPFMRILALHYDCAMNAALLEGWISQEDFDERPSYRDWSPECKSSFESRRESEVSSLPWDVDV